MQPSNEPQPATQPEPAAVPNPPVIPEPQVQQFQPTIISPTVAATPVSPAAPLVTGQPAAPVAAPAVSAPAAVPAAAAPALSPVQPAATPPAPAAAVTTPAGTGPIVVSGGMDSVTQIPNGQVVSGGSVLPDPPKKSKRKLAIFSGAGLLTLLVAGGVVFGLYLPNTPSNVYNTAIKRSGVAVNSLVQTATSTQKLEAYKTSKLSGSVDATYGESHYSGDFSTSFDKVSSDENVNVMFKDSAGTQQQVTLKSLSQIPSGSAYPNIYVQLTGLKSLGLDEFMPGISSYDGKWIFISSTYLQSLGNSFLQGGNNTQTQVTTEDVAEVVRTVSDVSQQYLFSTASEKAVLEKRSFVGKEQVDGLSAYHYTVGVNVAHAKAYCKALSDAVLSTGAYKKFAGHAATAADRSDSAKSCDSSDYGSLKDTYDMWIDGHYKLIYKVRFYDKADHGNYADVGQIYKGGDKLSLFVRGHETSSKTDGAFTIDTDLKTNQTTGNLTIKSTSPTSPYDVTVKLKAELASQPVQITTPTSSVKIEDVLKKFGIDPSGAGLAPVAKTAFKR